jgi:hypothetical protein
MIALICLFSLAIPDRPMPAAIDLNYKTQYGEMKKVDDVVTIEGDDWRAVGELRQNGKVLYLMWTEKSTGHQAPSFYNVEDMTGQWGWDGEVEENGTELKGDVKTDQLYKLPPPVIDL